jgi:hypothetical protein
VRQRNIDDSPEGCEASLIEGVFIAQNLGLGPARNGYDLGTAVPKPLGMRAGSLPCLCTLMAVVMPVIHSAHRLLLDVPEAEFGNVGKHVKP